MDQPIPESGSDEEMMNTLFALLKGGRKGKGKGKGKMDCYNRGKPGHMARDCRSKGGKGKGKNKGYQKEIGVNQKVEEEREKKQEIATIVEKKAMCQKIVRRKVKVKV